MKRTIAFLGILGAVGLAVACDASNETGSSGFGPATAGSTTGTGGGTTAATSTGEGVGGFDPTTSSSGSGGTTCVNDQAVDDDEDGFTEEQGDCNDCDANVNPAAIEVLTGDGGEGGAPPEPADEDCDDETDEVEPLCDVDLAIGSADPRDGARALDICNFVDDGSPWGLLDARYVRANGTSANVLTDVGILDGFGTNVNVQRGERMVGLSSGYARDAGDAGACGTISCNNNRPLVSPPDVDGDPNTQEFPQDSPGCQSTEKVIYDDIGLELSLRAPSNATGFRYRFKFHSFEFPEWVCTPYNDQYIALVDPPPAGAQDSNISFDSEGNPVSVNIAFFDVCDVATKSSFAFWCTENCPLPPEPYCPSGPAELTGTGFDSWGDAGATSWLGTQAPVEPGAEFTIRFAIWDTDDRNLDSTVLVDGFEWIATGGTGVIGTEEVPDPR